MIKFTGSDVLELKSSRNKTREGFLEATAALTCVGVQYYSGKQFGLDTNDLVGVFRPAETVFHKDTIASAKLKPITREHPDEDVTAENYKHLTAGTIGETVEPIDNTRLGAKVIINDANVIKEIEDGTVETSAGYLATLVEELGTHEGNEYQFKFDGPMIINHLAIVDRGRCGPNVKILDKGNDMTKEQIIKLLTDAGIIDADGKKVAVELKAEDLVEKLAAVMKKNDEAEKDAEKAAAEKAEKEAADKNEDDNDDEDKGDKEESKKDAAETALNDAVNVRVKLVTDCQVHLKDTDVSKMTNREILETALKDDVENIETKSDGYLMGVLDTINVDRKAAADKAAEMASVKDSSKGSLSAPMTGLEARELENEGK